jgi:hypothetical protein
MKVIYNISDKLSFEVESKSQKDLFGELASIQEIFGEDKCGVCGNSNLRFVTREVDGNAFYELRCGNHSCKAVLGFGQHKKSDTLFPQRKDKEGKYLPNNGWHKWQPTTEESKAPKK